MYSVKRARIPELTEFAAPGINLHLTGVATVSHEEYTSDNTAPAIVLDIFRLKTEPSTITISSCASVIVNFSIADI